MAHIPVQDILGTCKDLCAAVTMAVLGSELESIHKANWASFVLGVLGWAFVQIQKGGNLSASSIKIVIDIADIMLLVRPTFLGPHGICVWQLEIAETK